jgi:hypothetical protein
VIDIVTNIHTRDLHAPLSVAKAFIDNLASDQDILWPRENWPPMRLDRPLSVGAAGGHANIRYVVDSYEPGRYIRFRFTAPQGFIGTHCFSLDEINPDVVRIKHEIKMKLKGSARLWWPAAIRWLHDAVVEDAFDKAEAWLGSPPLHKRTWSNWVKFLRYLLGRKRHKQ